MYHVLIRLARHSVLSCQSYLELSTINGLLVSYILQMYSFGKHKCWYLDVRHFSKQTECDPL
jgi:hypothetical protein